MVILRVTPDAVTMADMLSGRVEVMPAEAFYEPWSAYLLVPSSPACWSRILLLFAGFAAAAAFVS